MISEIVTDVMSSVIDSSISKMASSIVASADWKRIFIQSGSFVSGFESVAGSFDDAIEKAFSKDNLQEIAKKYRGKSGFEFSEIEKDVLELLTSYDVPYDCASSYAKRFMLVLRNQIRLDFPDQYNQYFQEQAFEETQKSLSKIENLLFRVQKTVDDLRNNLVNVMSLDEADQYLRKSTHDPSIGIDFFEPDDNDFIKNLKKDVDNDILYVRGRCREETAYCVLFELRKICGSKPIYIVKSKEDWDKIRRLSESGNIFIADFYADEIEAIENNTCVFLLNETQKDPFIKAIQLRPRTFRTLRELLKKAGLDSDTAYRYVQETHGLYIPLKKKIFNGLINTKPSWLDDLDERVLKTCLLLEQWTDDETDRSIVESLSGISFEEFDKAIRKYSNDEEPLVIVVRRNGGNFYSISSVENTWGYVTIKTSEAIWKDFVEWLKIVVSEPERLLILDTAQKFMASLHGERLSCSKEIRDGMLNSLIVMACYKEEESCQYQLDQITEEILQCVDSVDKWDYISNFFAELCEISPSVVLNRLEQEFNQSTGLLDLFNRQSPDFLMGRNAYIQILFGVEEFLYQDQYKKQAIQWLLKLDDLSLSYTSNSPSSLLEKVFWPMEYLTAIHSVEDRIAMAKMTLDTDRNGWEIIYRAIESTSILISSAAPKYRDNITRHQNTDITVGDYFSTMKAYCNLLIQHIDLVPDRFDRLIKVSDRFDEETRGNLFSELQNDIASLSDEELVKIKNSLREFIYRIRFFEQYSEVLTEDTLVQYEQLLESITVKKAELEYVYLFSDEFHVPILNPVSVNEENHYEENKATKEKLCTDKLTEFRDRNLDLRVLANECGKLQYSTLNTYLGQLWNDGKYSADIFKLLLEEQPSGVLAIGYCRVANADVIEDKYRSAIVIAKEVSPQIVSKLYIEEAGEALYNHKIPMIKDADEEIKEAYWKSANCCYMPYDQDSWKWVLPECRKYGCLETYLNLLHTGVEKEIVTAEELYEALMDMDYLPLNSENSNDRTLVDYSLSELLKVLYEKYHDNPTICLNLARIEIRYSPLLEFAQMPFYHKAINDDPTFYAELLDMAFLVKDDGSKREFSKDQQYVQELCYSLYDKSMFCPGFVDDKVDSELLQKWIDKFSVLMNGYHLASMTNMILGKLFAYAPAGEDGAFPCDAVCQMIEKYYDKHLAEEYIVTTVNKRGMYTVNAGESERALSEKYYQNAKKLSQKGYAYTARIYHDLGRQYDGNFEYERIAAENGLL